MSLISDEARARAPFPEPSLTAILAVIMAISTVFTLARMYTRFHVHQRIWWDDWTMVAAWLGTVALCGIQIHMIRFGSGVNFDDVPPNARKVFSNLFLDTQMVARTAIFFARLSILLLYIRIFFPLGTERTTTWWVIWLTILVNLLYTISLILVTTLQCVPKGLPFGSTCVNQFLVFILASVINIITDLAVLLIPVARIWKLQMSRQRKYAICALFAFGALAPIASIARLGYQIPMGTNPNKTAIYPVIAVLATAEQGVAMVIGSAPVCSSLVLKVVRGSRGSSPNANASMAQRVWPSRERKEASSPKRRKPADPFRITTITGNTSQEGLHPQESVSYGHSTNHEYVELTTSHDMPKGP